MIAKAGHTRGMEAGDERPVSYPGVSLWPGMEVGLDETEMRAHGWGGGRTMAACADCRVCIEPWGDMCVALSSSCPDTTQTVPEDSSEGLVPPLELCIRTK